MEINAAAQSDKLTDIDDIHVHIHDLIIACRAGLNINNNKK